MLKLLVVSIWLILFKGSAPLDIFPWYAQGAQTASFSTDNQMILFAKEDGSMVFFDIKSGAQIPAYWGHTGRNPVNLGSNQSPWEFNVATDGRISVSSKQGLTWPAKSSAKNSVVISSDEKMVLTGSHQSGLELWEFKSEKHVHQFKGSLAQAVSGANRTQESIVVSAPKKVRSELRLATFKSEGKGVLASRIAGKLKLRQLGSGKTIRQLAPSSGGLSYTAVFKPKQKRLYISTPKGNLLRLNSSKAQQLNSQNKEIIN